ncbi:MAG: hypothetical protein F4W94_10490 [Acidimicrobiia bacterium]|nr:hypothetical protein [bacterium]MXW68678.1 hypothetical protein [Acidimicrobiia bacterium]MYD42128.1 hypothetical protein [Acidimicrobiia bacterium]
MAPPPSIVPSDIDRQVADNYRAFVNTHLSKLIGAHEGQWAILHDQDIIKVCPTMSEAYREGLRLYSDHMFSVQEICEQVPITMGGHTRVI